MKSGKLLVIVAVIVLNSIWCFGQTSPNLENGFKHWGSFDSTKIDTVSTLNGNVMFHAPVMPDYPQRGGITLSDILYNTSKTWQVQCKTDQQGGTTCFWNTQWMGIAAQLTPGLTVQRTVTVTASGTGTSTYNAWGYNLVSADGSTHQVYPIVGTADSTGEATQFDSLDTSGYHMTMSVPDANGVMSTATVADRHGTQYLAVFGGAGQCWSMGGNNLGNVRLNGGAIQPLIDDAPLGIQNCPASAYAVQITDSNGNRVTMGANSTGADTLNRPLPLTMGSTTTDFSGCSSTHPIVNAMLLNYTGGDGSAQQIKLCQANINIQTAFGAAYILEAQNYPSAHSIQIPQVVTAVLGDGSKWTFDYDSYGNVTFIGLPTGGSITYTWTTITVQPLAPTDGGLSRAVATRTLNDNNGHSYTTTYSWGTLVNGVITNTVTDPLGNDTVHVFTNLGNGGLYETRTQYYQGTGGARQLLKQVDTTYSSAVFGVETEMVFATGNVVPTSIQTTVYPSGKVSLVTKAYDPGPGNGRPVFGNVVTEKEYDWGQGAPGALLQETDTTYQWQVNSSYLTAGLVDLPASVVVKDASGNRMAETDYFYDEAGYLTASGVTTQHGGPPASVRGNLTTVKKWLNSNGSWITSHINWYDTGEVYQQIDPLGHTTTHSYDAAYVGAYSTKTCNALSQCVSGTYNFNTGLLTSFTDANASYQASGNTQGDPNHTSNYSYDSMFRLTSAQSPPDASGNRALTTLTYSPPNSFPLNIQRQKSITATMNDNATAYFDGLARGYRLQHLTPNGNATVDTTYDGLGQVVQVTNPYFSTSDATYGVIQSQYDALGRVIQITKQDGSATTAAYDIASVSGVLGNCDTATDEAGKQRRACSDGLGRLIEVDEPQASAVATSSTASATVSGSLSHAIVILGTQTGKLATYAISDGQHVDYISSDQHVHQLYFNSSSWAETDQDLTAATNGPLAASGSGLAGYGISDGQHVYYIGTNQHVYQAFYNNTSWNNQDLTSFASGPLASSGSGVAAYAITDGQHVYYIGSDQHVYQLFYNNTAWYSNDLTSWTGGPLAASSSAVAAYAISDGQHVYYDGSDQHVYQLYYNNTAWYSQDLTNITGGALVANGSGVAGYAISDGQHIYYVGGNQHVYQLYYNNQAWYNQDFTSWTGGPLAASGSPVSAYAISDGQHAYYLSADNHVHQFYYNSATGGLSDQDLTAFTGGPTAASGSGLAAYATSDGQHVDYISSNQHIHQLLFSYSTGTWSDQDLSYVASTYANDSGLVYLTLGGYTATACYGSSTNPACNGQPANNTSAQVAAALAQAVNVSASPATATASGSTVNLIWKNPGPGGAAVGALSTIHDNPALFPNVSFTSPSTSFAGGAYTPLTNPYVTQYSYDVLGNLLNVTQKGGTTDSSQWRVRTFTYDSLSRLLTAYNPESGTISYSYDGEGNLLQKTSPAPNQTGSATQTLSYCYDPLHRVTGKAYSAQSCPLNSPVVTYSYDAGTNGIGHLTSLTDQAGTGSYSYDNLGRITNEQRTIAGINKGLAYSYKLDDSVSTLTYPSGAVLTYTPDAAGRMLSAVDNGNNLQYVTGATYGPDNSLMGFVSGHTSTFAGITNNFSYNKRLQPITMSASAPNQTVFSLGYDFHFGAGDNGNVMGIINYRDQSRNQAFTYDSLNRLASAQNAGTDCTKMTANGSTQYWGNSYGYDAWGNLLQKTVTKCSAENLSVAALANNQLVGYTYDAAGNMTHDATSGQNYTYDAENRITGAGGYTYIYDVDGNRVKKSNGSSGTIYWYMTPGIVAESDLTGALKSEYVFFNGRRTARKDFPGGAVSYYFSDHLGTASVITNSAGTITEDEDFYPWGGELQFVNNDSNHYKFTGKERDSETSLDYFGARYYSNWLGRWLSPDWAAKPVAVPYAVLGDPQTLNLYGYTRNVPTTLIDDDGHGIGTPDWTSQESKARRSEIASLPASEQFKRGAIGTCVVFCGPAAALGGVEAAPLARVLFGLALASAPVTVPIVVDILEGATPGPSGTLTIAKATRLTAQEISAGSRYARKTGTALIESTHVGEEFVDAAKKTYDVMGQAGAYSHWNFKKFSESIIDHLSKVDKTIIDLKGASKAQIKEIKDFVKTLTKEQQKKIDYVQ